VTMRFGNSDHEFTVSRNAATDQLPSGVEVIAPGEFLVAPRQGEGTQQIILGIARAAALPQKKGGPV
jgi:hypothetical protein